VWALKSKKIVKVRKTPYRKFLANISGDDDGRIMAKKCG
jgi:hypothetical protein